MVRGERQVSSELAGGVSQLARGALFDGVEDVLRLGGALEAHLGRAGFAREITATESPVDQARRTMSCRR